MTTDSVSTWCCTDCIMLFADGENPPEMSGDVAATWHASIDARTDGFDVALGGDHDEDCPNVDHETGKWLGATSCSCEELEFSWRSCGTCGSTLGGSRHAVTLFPR